MFEKIKTIHQHPFLQQFKDVRAIGLLVFGVIVLLVTWSSLGAIQANFELQKEISKLQQENKVNELENTNLKLKNEYYNTDQYLELTARRQFGLAAPGEKVLLVPKSVALAHTVETLKEDKQAQTVTLPGKPWYQHNFEAWMDFLLHRNAED
jgi:cell division protein FtsB